MIYLNNAATGFPKPQSVTKAVDEMLRNIPLEQLRGGFSQGMDTIFECRKLLSNFFHAKDPSQIVFTSGGTESLNLCIKGLPLKGKHVITTVTEHNSVLRPLKTMESENIISLTFVPCNENGIVSVQEIEKAIQPETTAIVVNHCSNVTGTLNDIESIGKLAQRTGILFIVDASQSAGNYPIDVYKMNLDIF